MISHRSALLVVGAVLVLACPSCLHTHGADRQQLDVRADARADLAHLQGDELRAARAQPEYFEGAAAPALPEAPHETVPAAPSAAHVWIAGEHTRRGGGWVWVEGRHAVPPRSDVVWVAGHWVPHLHGFLWIEGAWR